MPMESASAGLARARALAEAVPERASLVLSQTVRQLAGLDLREGLAGLPSRVQAALGDLTPEQRQAAVSLGLVGLWAYGYLAHTRPPIESAAEAWARAHPPPYPVRRALSAPARCTRATAEPRGAAQAPYPEPSEPDGAAIGAKLRGARGARGGSGGAVPSTPGGKIRTTPRRRRQWSRRKPALSRKEAEASGMLDSPAPIPKPTSLSPVRRLGS